MDSYLDLARQGKNDWWRFVLAVLTVFFFWQVLGAIPTVLLYLGASFGDDPAALAAPADGVGIDPLLAFTALMLASLFFLLGLYLALRFIHRRRLLTLVTPAASISWPRLAQGFMLWSAICGLTALGEALLYPGRYVLTLDPPRFVPLVFLALALVPIQASTEELFFRGYLLQGFGLRLRNIWLLSLVSGVLFGVPHLLNPEAGANYLLMGLYYVSIGAGLAYVALRDGRLELALGLHAANNLFTALFANYTVTVMPTPALFTINTLDATYSLLALLPGLLVFVLVFFGPRQGAGEAQAG